MMTRKIDASPRPPPLLWTALDAPRALFESCCLWNYFPWLSTVPKGDGHPVMVIPGFLGNDLYNRPLVTYLRKIGYHATGWKQGRNIGHGLLDPDLLTQRVKKLYGHENRKVTLVGHSLGGVYAREIAKLVPDEIRQVITLGSPFGDGRRSASRLDSIYQKVSPHKGIDDDKNWSEPPPVPTTAIYSRTDGLVDWRVTLQRSGHEQTENVEVCGSHNGLTLNPLVWLALADRLALDMNNWQPFKRRFMWQFAYPKAAFQPGTIGA